MCTLRAVLNAAMSNNWILDNPFDMMRRGELIKSGYEEPVEERYYTENLWVH